MPEWSEIGPVHANKLIERGPRVVVEKRGRQGCRIHRADALAEDVPGFEVTVQNILGAGDAFGAGFCTGT